MPIPPKSRRNHNSKNINKQSNRYISDLWNRTNRLDSSAAGAYIAVGEAGLAMQSGVAVSVHNTSSSLLKKKQRNPLNWKGKTKWVIEWRGKRTWRAEEESKRKRMWNRRTAISNLCKKWRWSIEWKRERSVFRAGILPGRMQKLSGKLGRKMGGDWRKKIGKRNGERVESLWRNERRVHTMDPVKTQNC